MSSSVVSMKGFYLFEKGFNSSMQVFGANKRGFTFSVNIVCHFKEQMLMQNGIYAPDASHIFLNERTFF